MSFQKYQFNKFQWKILRSNVACSFYCDKDFYKHVRSIKQKINPVKKIIIGPERTFLSNFVKDEKTA